MQDSSYQPVYRRTAKFESMGGSGVMDFMVKSYRSNRVLLRGRKKSLKRIYQENNLLYIKRRVAEKTRHFDETQKRIFLEKFHARQKKARQRSSILLIILIAISSVIFVVVF